MELTRRHFIGAIGAAVTLGLSSRSAFGQRIADDGLFSIPAGAGNDPLSYLTKEHFTPFIGTAFRGRGSRGTRTFTLIAVDDNVAALKGGKPVAGYSLVFESRRKAEDDLYSFDHPSLGRLDLFVSGFGLAGTKYQAIVNRLIQKGD